MNNRILSRRGSTLVELIVAMALVSIVSIMIVSFSAMAHSFSGDEQGKHQFIDDCAAIRRDINDFLLTCDTEKDVVGGSETVITVASNGLNCTNGKFIGAIYTSDKVMLGDRVLDGVAAITFVPTSNPKLLKCTVTGATEKGQTYSQTFVFALRCATFQ